MSSISIRNLNKAYGSVDVLKNVNLEIESGEFAVFVGPSGCGKSTLLRCIAGLEDISSGELVIDGALANDTPPAGRGIAMVFQSYALYPHMNVFDNMAYSLKLKKLPKEAIRSKVEAAADKLQLTPYLSRYPKELSGGQRQRVAIGRAIVRDPRVFLFDEPLSNLDAALRVQMRLEIGALKDLLPNTTMIYVTHDQVEAMTMADRIVVLRDGKIEQVGSPLELYERPTSQFVAGFIGSPKMNFLAAPFAAEFGCDVLGVRAEHLSIDRDAGKWAGKVVHSENLGADNFVYVDINGAENLVVRTGGRNMFKIGEQVFLTPDANEIHRFGDDGIPVDKP